MITSVIKSSLPTINPRIDSTKKNIVNEKNPIKSYLSMTSSTPDIIHIDIESPDIRSNNNSHVPQSTLELIAQREMEGSRIRRSRNKQKNKNSASILPINENESNVNHENKNDENDDQKKTNEPVVFTRDEVYLLRQVLSSSYSPFCPSR